MIASLSLTVAILTSIILFDIADDAFALTRHGETKQQITVSDVSELSYVLSDAGMIKHPWLFSVYASLKNVTLERNTAFVSESMDYRALLSAFTAAPPTQTIRISFPKSSSVADIIDIFVSNGIGSREGFVDVINSYPFNFDFIAQIPDDSSRIYRLEGYLYPDTYDFYTGRNESYYIDRMLRRFDAVISELEAFCSDVGMSLDEALTVASLIECSAGFPSSYERMSSVIQNRSKASLPLNIPASSVYGLSARSDLFTGEPSEEITLCDSPYNTFKNKELPPSAICNPTKESVMCAIFPEKSSYLYFITRKNGSVLFAETLSEHRQNVALQ